MTRRAILAVATAVGLIVLQLAMPSWAGAAGPIQSLASGKCLDLEGGATGDGAVVIQYQCHAGPNQQWTVESAGGGGYRIVSRLSGKCVGIDRSAGSGASAPVVQSACGSGASEQLWSLVNGHGGYVFKSIASGRCLDVPGGSGVNGVRLVAWKCEGGPNQVWRLAP